MMQIPYESDAPDIHQSAFIAPTAVLIGKVKIAEESSVWFHSILRGDINSITIGSQTNIQDGCMCHVTQRHPLVVGNKVTVGHGAILHGCDIGSGSLIAMGAIVLDGAIIGEESVVAAGTVVPPGTQIPAHSLVMGVPGKVVRQLTPQDKERVMRGWQNYVGYAANYRLQLAAQHQEQTC